MSEKNEKRDTVITVVIVGIAVSFWLLWNTITNYTDALAHVKDLQIKPAFDIAMKKPGTEACFTVFNTEFTHLDGKYCVTYKGGNPADKAP